MAPNRRWQRELVLTLGAAAVIGWLTLRPSEGDAESAVRLPWTCLVGCDDYGLRDALLNVALFIPLGWALARWLHPRRAQLLVILSTVSIEFTQYHWLLGRDASLRDILTNSLGGGLGILLTAHWRHLLLPAPRQSRTLGTLALLGWLGVVLATAVLVRPSLPASTYWGQWAPELGQFAIWEGTIRSATVADLPLRSGRMADSRPLRDRLRRDSVLVTAQVLAAPGPHDIAPIVSVFDGEQREIFLLGQRFNGLTFRLRTAARSIQLGDLTAWLPELPPYHPGDSMTVWGGVTRGAWILGATTPQGTVQTRIPYSVGLLWAALWPFHPRIGPDAALISGLWLGLLLLPGAFWWSLAGGDNRLLGIVAAAALYLVCRLWGLAPPALPEPLGVLAGAGLGALLARSARRVRADPVH